MLLIEISMTDKQWNKALSQIITDTHVVINKRKYYTKYQQTVKD